MLSSGVFDLERLLGANHVAIYDVVARLAELSHQELARIELAQLRNDFVFEVDLRRDPSLLASVILPINSSEHETGEGGQSNLMAFSANDDTVNHSGAGTHDSVCFREDSFHHGMFQTKLELLKVTIGKTYEEYSRALQAHCLRCNFSGCLHLCNPLHRSGVMHDYFAIILSQKEHAIGHAHALQFLACDWDFRDVLLRL